MVGICLLVARTFLLTAVVVTAIPISDFISFPAATTETAPISRTLGSSVTLPRLQSFNDIEAQLSGRLRFVSGSTSIEVLNLGFGSGLSTYTAGSIQLQIEESPNLESVVELVARVFPDDSSFAPSVGVVLGAGGATGTGSVGPHTFQTVFVSDGTLSFVLFLLADGMIGTITSDLELGIEFLSLGESAGSGTSLFAHPNSGTSLDGVATQSNGCIAGLYAVRLDSTVLAPGDITQPVTRLIPAQQRQPLESTGDFNVCIRSCGAAGILDTNIRVNFATADRTAIAPQDYRQSSGSLEFDIGDTRQCVTLNIRDDTTVERNQVFFIEWTLDFSNADDRTYELRRARTRIVIRDNDVATPSTPSTPSTRTPAPTTRPALTTRPAPTTRPPPRFCWICTRSRWLTRRQTCIFVVRNFCGFTFPIPNEG